MTTAGPAETAALRGAQDTPNTIAPQIATTAKAEVPGLQAARIGSYEDVSNGCAPCWMTLPDSPFRPALLSDHIRQPSAGLLGNSGAIRLRGSVQDVDRTAASVTADSCAWATQPTAIVACSLTEPSGS